MVVSLSHALDAARPAGTIGGAPACLNVTPDAIVYRANRAGRKQSSLNLRQAEGLAELRRIGLLWPDMSETEQNAWLDSQELLLPPCATDKTEIALLPGGAVVLRGPANTLVSDPLEAAIFNQAEVKQLRRLLRGRTDITTLLHTGDGVVLHRRFPKQLPPQAVSIVPSVCRLPFRVSFAGPALIQWGHHGAVARPLVAADGLLALAASVAASPQISEGIRSSPVIVTQAWQAADAADRHQLISVALMEHFSELVAGLIGDELRYRLMAVFSIGPDSLAARIAKALAALPTCFGADPDAFPGTPPPVWRCAMQHIREAVHPRALLGLDELGDPLIAIRSLRDTLEHAEVMAFDETGGVLPGGPAALHSDAALFLARKAGPHGRLAVAIPTPISPLDLYTQAHEVMLVSKARIIAVAPGWGFCHRIGPDGEEAGNAGWFGMGPGLEELDDVLGDIEVDA